MTASPDNTKVTAVDLGSLTNAGDTFTVTGSNTTGTAAWYSFTLPSTDFLSFSRFTVTGSTGDSASLLWSLDSRTLHGASTDFTYVGLEGDIPTYYIKVSGGTADTTFTLNVSVLVGPPTSTQEDSATSLGTLTVGGSALTATDSNTYGTVKWYSVTVPYGLSLVNFALTGSASDALTLFQGGSIFGPTTDGNDSLLAEAAYIAVAGGASGTPFTLTVTPPAS